LLVINLENKIGKGEKLEIEVGYVASLYKWTHSSGLNVVEYYDTDSKEHDYNGPLKQFVVNDFNVDGEGHFCSNAFPCIEKKNLKTTFNLTLIHKNEYQTIANGDFVETAKRFIT